MTAQRISIDSAICESTTCCERHLLDIIVTISGNTGRFALLAHNGAKWRCPECGKKWIHVCGTPCGWEEVA